LNARKYGSVTPPLKFGTVEFLVSGTLMSQRWGFRSDL
jgi:hypothetical protein